MLEDICPEEGNKDQSKAVFFQFFENLSWFTCVHLPLWTGSTMSVILRKRVRHDRLCMFSEIAINFHPAILDEVDYGKLFIIIVRFS